MQKPEQVIESLTDMKAEIENSFFFDTKFKNNNLEILFLKSEKERSLVQDFLGDSMVILGYIANLLYIFVAYYRKLILVYCLSMMFLTLGLSIISYKVNKKSMKNFLSHIQVFLISFFLNSKVFILNFYFNDQENENSEELLRIIIYDYISTNLFILVKLECNLGIYIFYYFMNLFSIIICELKSLKNHYYFLDAFTSLSISIIFYTFSKVWSYKIRSIFSEKYKFESLYSYTYDFLNGINGYQINFRDKKFIDSNAKFSNFLHKFSESKKNNDKEIINTNESKEDKYLNPPQFGSILTLNKINYEKDENLKSQKQEANIEKFMDSLIEIEYTNNLLFSNINQNDNKNNILNLSNDEANFNKIKKEYSLNCLMKKLFADDKNYEINFYLGVYELIDFKDMNNNDYFTNENDNYILNHISTVNKNGYNLLENTNKFNCSLMENVNSVDKNNNNKKKKFFDVFFRKIKFFEDHVIYNIILYDVTELILTKRIIEDDTKLKQKLFGKIVNEIKTPINCIIDFVKSKKNSLIEKFENDNSSGITHLDSNINRMYTFNIIDENNKCISQLNKNKISKNSKNQENKSPLILFRDFSLIQNLSSYLLFLITDLVHYINLDNMFNLRVEKEKIKLKDIVGFCYDILNTVLCFNKIKKDKIRTELIFSKENSYDTENLVIATDSFKVKQILLNFLSNSIKFTYSGKIIIECKIEKNFDNKKNKLIVSVRDSGTGIKLDDRKKILENFENERTFRKSLNMINNGYGLSICKNLADVLKMKLHFDSEYGKGTEFSLIIPLNSNTVPILDIFEDDILNKNGYSSQTNRIIGKNSNRPLMQNKVNTRREISMKTKDEKILKNENYIPIENESKNTTITSNIDSKKNNEIQINNNVILIDNNSSSDEEKNKKKLKKKISMNNDFESNISLGNGKEINNESQKEKILVVINNNEMFESTKIILDSFFEKYKLDYNIQKISDSIEMIKYILDENNKKFKYVIFDEDSEYKSGIESKKFIKNLETKKRLEKINIISITSNDDEIMLEKIKNSGADFILQKPIKLTDFEEIFKKLSIIE